MKEAAFVGFILALLVGIGLGFVGMMQDVSNQKERNEKAFLAECAAVNGRAVWNHKYWECLK
jgi:hypothetical protein